MIRLAATRWYKVIGVVLVGMAAGLPAAPIDAQGAQAADTPALGADDALDTMLADRLVLFSIRSLEGLATPSPEQIALATTLMDMSLAIDDTDAEVWRSRAELAELAGDTDRQEAALRQYIRLMPQDDAAQLKLIMMRTTRLQTIDQRLAMLERVLNARSASRLSKPLRSRLATAAAMFAAELDQPEAHFRHLRNAVKLDPANPTAAALTYQYAIHNNASPVQVGALLANVVKTSPLDPAARLSFAYALAQEAAYERAAQQFKAAAQLAGAPLSLEDYRRWALSLGASGQQEDLDGMLHELTDYVAAADPPQALPVEFELIRLAMLDPAADAGQPKETFNRIAKQMLADSQDEAAARQARADIALLAAVFGVETQRIDGLLEQAPPDNISAQIARGWMAYRQGDLDTARALLGERAQEQPLASLGLAFMARQDEAGNTRLLYDLIHGHPTHIVALLAARELYREQRAVPATGPGQSLVQQMDRAPNDLWRFDLDGNRWIDLRVQINPMLTKFGEPIDAVITIRNRSQLPLAVGEGSPIPTQVVYAITAAVSGQTLPPVDLAIADAGRRLTLMPGESLTFTTQLSSGPFARVMDEHAFVPLSFSTLAVLEPRTTTGGGLVAGPMGAAGRVNLNKIRGGAATQQNVDRWLADLDGDDAAEQARALALLAQIGSALPGAAVDDALVQKVADQLNERFKNMTTQQRAWVMLFLPPSDGMGRPTQPMIDVAKRSDQPLLRLAYLLSQVRDPDAPAIASGLRHSNRTIRDFASNYQVFLKSLDQAPPPEAEE